MFPSLFISHGAPNTILKDSKTKINLQNLAKSLDKPKYILIISAHWTTKNLEIISSNANKIMYDFYGFEEELYNYKYKLSSNKEITNEVLEKLKDLNIYKSSKDSYDHGVWTILAMMYKKLDIPVINLSLPLNFTIQELFNLGKKLRVLKDEALLIFSGSITHNLLDIYPKYHANVKPYAYNFDKKIEKLLENGQIQTLLEFKNIENFNINHPTIEHFLPLIIALGTTNDYKAQAFNEEFIYSNISMKSYIFKG